MKLLLDHHISPLVAIHLREVGHDVVSAAEQNWQRAPDEDLVVLASGDRRTVVTANVRHFAPIARDMAERGEDHWGIVIASSSFPLRMTGLGQAVRILAALLDAHQADDAFRNRVHWL